MKDWFISAAVKSILSIILPITSKVEGLARISKNAGGRPRLASVAFDGRFVGLAL